MRFATSVNDSTIAVHDNDGSRTLHTPVGFLLAQQDYCAGEVVFTEKFNHHDLVRAELLQGWIDLLSAELSVTNERMNFSGGSHVPMLRQ